MKNLKRLGKYFAITFLVVLACALIGILSKEVERGTFYDLTIGEALGYCMRLGLSGLSALIPYSLCIATFLSFWIMNSEKWAGFFRALAIGLVLVLPLSVMTYYYDWSVRPQMKAASAREMMDIKLAYPESLADKYDIDKEQILKKHPMTMPKTKLVAWMDSLEASLLAGADTCGLLLAILPDTLASEAYESYRLEEMGVAYQYAAHPTASKDSLMFIQKEALYQRAISTWESLTELRRCRIECYDRMLSTACIYIGYFLFAILGYLLRYKPIKKILTVIAVLIVAICIYREIDSLIQKHVQKTNTISQQTVSATYEEIDRIKETASQNRENEIE